MVLLLWTMHKGKIISRVRDAGSSESPGMAVQVAQLPTQPIHNVVRVRPHLHRVLQSAFFTLCDGRTDFHLLSTPRNARMSSVKR